MKIELDEKDIMDEIKENFKNDLDFLYRVVDQSTSSWEDYRNLVVMLLKNLKKNGELDMEFINEELQK